MATPAEYQSTNASLMHIRPATKAPILQRYNSWDQECNKDARTNIHKEAPDAILRILKRVNDRKGLSSEVTPTGIDQAKYAIDLGVAAIKASITDEFVVVDMKEAASRPISTGSKLQKYSGLIVFMHSPEMTEIDTVNANEIYAADKDRVTLATILLPAATHQAD